MKNKVLMISVIALLGILLTSLASAAIYVKIPGIPGESKDENHDKWIDVLSIDWGVHKPTGKTGQSRRRGGAIVEDMSFTKQTDSASPKLSEPICTGKAFPSVLVDVCETGSDGKQHCYLKYELKNVIISSYGIGGSATEVPTEDFALNFEEIKVTYIPEVGDEVASMCSA